MSHSVAVRLFNNDQNTIQDVPIMSYLPVILDRDQNMANISKRVQQLFLKKNPQVIKAHWQYDEQDPGVWVYPDHYESVQ